MEASAMDKIQEERKKLPIYAMRYDLIRAVDDNQIVIIVGDPGSGKTTQIPQYLHEAGYTQRGIVICTQPHRVATISAANRVSKEMGVKLGDEVGYYIPEVSNPAGKLYDPLVPPENCLSSNTFLNYITDDMLVHILAQHTALDGCIAVMIDEAHERTLSTDILFGMLRRLSRQRTDLKVIISTATCEAEKLSNYFYHAPILHIPTRRFPVDLHYTEAPVADYLDESIVRILQILKTQPPGDGDILVFLTCREEIERAAEILEQKTRGLADALIICPLHDDLPTEIQDQVFEATPPGARKVVLATDIAETSLTIDGIKYVIDPGFCKLKSCSSKAGKESLQVTLISRASADWRAALAGRTAPGECFRLYTCCSFSHERDDNTTIEVMRIHLLKVVQAIYSLGIDEPLNFQFIDRPPGF